MLLKTLASDIIDLGLLAKGMLKLLLTDRYTTNDNVYVTMYVHYIRMYTRLPKRCLNQLDKILPVSMDDSCRACLKVKKLVHLCACVINVDD